MKMKFFWVPATQEDSPQAQELNRFLSQTRIVTVERQFCAQPTPAWAVCVEFSDLPATGKKEGSASNSSSDSRSRKPPIDYREVLDAETFQIFASLRSLRKEIAEAHGVPLYAVASNEQLAAIAKGRFRSLTQLESIEGIGKARLEKYGEALLAGITKLLGDEEEVKA